MALRDRLPIIGQPRGPQAEGAPTQPLERMTGHTPPPPDPGTVRPRPGQPPYGQSGRANFYGLPQPDETNPRLAGPQGIRLFDEMYRTDAHVRRLILAAWSPVTAGTWLLEPFGGEDATDKDRKIAEQIWWLITEWMSPNFYEFLHSLGPLLLRSGFTPFEQVNWQSVKHDGETILAPKKLDARLPRYVWKWWQDDYGDLTHIAQILPNRPEAIIPASELLYFRLGGEGDNWQGVSLLRHCYKHWFAKDRLERIQMIGEERKAVGVPIVYHSTDVPPSTLNDLETAIANMHTSEVAYLMVPGRKMGAGNQSTANTPGMEFLIDVIQFDSSSGSTIKDAIEYHQMAIASSFLTDFLELGHHQVGARATAEVQEDPFMTAVNGALLPPIMPVLNRFIDRVRQLNWDSDGSPTLKLTMHDDASLSEIATYVQQLVAAEAIQVDPDLEDWLRERGGLPAANADVRTQRLAQQQVEQQASMAKAQANAADPQGLKAAAAQAAIKNGAGLGANGEPKNAEPPNPNVPPQPAKKLDTGDPPIAAGLIVHAADTGRVLMIQRTDDHADDDDTRARWEFGGGKLDDGETPWQGGLREWQEETGATLPKGARRIGSFVTPDGKYQAFGLRVPHEQDVKLGAHDAKEVSAVDWWKPEHLATDHRIRGKVQEMLPDVHRLIGSKTLDQPQAGDSNLVCVDFDGVIHPKDPNSDGPPMPGAAELLSRVAARYNLCILTARSDLTYVREYLRRHALGEYASRVTNVKPPAIAYVDDRAVHPDGDVDRTLEKIEQRRIGLDAPSPPPNLRVSDSSEVAQPEHECGTCRMFDHGLCWGYGNFPTRDEWVCDSWELSPNWREQDAEADAANPKTPASAGTVELDEGGFAPLSGGTGSEGGLQMVPEVGKPKPVRKRKRSAATEVDADQKAPEEDDGDEDEQQPPRKHAHTLDADPAAEPTVKWFERLLSQDKLRQAFDGCRDHIQAAVGPHALLAARQMANQAANGALQPGDPPADLVDALTTHYEDMYRLGHATVADELARQRSALGKQLDDPTTSDLIAEGVATSRLGRARQRGEHSARNIANKISEVLGRSQITGLQDPAALQTAAETAAASALRMEALANTAASVNDGRADGAMSATDIAGAYYTSVLDERTCGECEKADTGILLSPEEAVALGPPNPTCAGQDRCRCALVWVISGDPAALQTALGD